MSYDAIPPFPQPLFLATKAIWIASEARELAGARIHLYLVDHYAGDWGHASVSEMGRNVEALRSGDGLLVSVFPVEGGSLRLVTDAAREITTVDVGE